MHVHVHVVSSLAYSVVLSPSLSPKKQNDPPLFQVPPPTKTSALKQAYQVHIQCAYIITCMSACVLNSTMYMYIYMYMYNVLGAEEERTTECNERVLWPDSVFDRPV